MLVEGFTDKELRSLKAGALLLRAALERGQPLPVPVRHAFTDGGPGLGLAELDVLIERFPRT